MTTTPTTQRTAIRTRADATKRRFARLRALFGGRFPLAFPGDGQDRQPLAIGIHKPLREAFPEMPSREIHWFLHRWCRRRRYLEALQRGGIRIALDGSPAGEVDEPGRSRAAGMLEVLRQPRVVTPRPKHGPKHRPTAARRQCSPDQPAPAARGPMLASAAKAG